MHVQCPGNVFQCFFEIFVPLESVRLAHSLPLLAKACKSGHGGDKDGN